MKKISSNKMNSSKLNINSIAFMAMCITLNFILCNIALVLRLPIYLDTTGTLLTGVLLGPLAGAIVGGLTTIINGISVDPVSLYFIPVQICIGMTTGLLFKRPEFDGIKSIVAILVIGLLSAALSSLIVAFVFDGVTTSGSSLIVAGLRNFGVDKFMAVFSTQIVTDLLDKSLCFSAVFAIIKILPKPINRNTI